MCRFLGCFADILYIPSGVDCYHAVQPNGKFGRICFYYKYNKIVIDLKDKVFLLISLIINSIYLLALEQSEQYTVGSNLV